MSEPNIAISASDQTRRDRVTEIDLLRFIAAFMVVIYHYTFRGFAANGYSPIGFPELVPITKYGYLGLPLFFMISGFVISMSISSGSLKKFLISRIVRLYPAFWFCCSLTFLIVMLFGAPTFSASWSQYFINLTMLNELIGVRSIDGVYWSLAVELKFYAMMACVLAFGQLRRIEVFMLLWLVVAGALALYPIERLNSWIIAEYAPYFIAGTVTYFVYTHGFTALRALLIFAAWTLSLHIEIQRVAWFAKTFNVKMDPIVIAILITAAFGIMLLIATKRMGIVARMNWVALGTLTYPLYLLHQNIGYIFFQKTVGTAHPYVLLTLLIAGMLLLSYLVHKFIERPFAPLLKAKLERLFRGRTSESRVG
jgi:peptidoglycan/LPS O-acetylase OafA/YrhL